ncbi:MAG: hypothetical protein L0Z55_12280 [Planctomycetes bacterium]|nr:hypothetical protein [Planctomycetota bacterium]
MMQKPEQVRAFEDSYSRARPADYFENMRIFEALWREAVALGVLPGQDPLAGIDHDIRLARILNSVP